jgi:hypothetical protein
MTHRLVDNAATVGVDKAAKEPLWMPVHNRPLPVDERNLPQMLPARPMLWKEAGPGLRIRVNLGCVAPAHKMLDMDNVPRQDSAHRRGALPDDARVSHVERDA